MDDADPGDRDVSTIQITKGSQEVVRATKQVPAFPLPGEEESPLDTPKYFVETVWERMRLNKETAVPW